MHDGNPIAATSCWLHVGSDTILTVTRGRCSNLTIESLTALGLAGLVSGVLLCVGPMPALAQEAQGDNGGRKQARAVRVADGAIRVDGRLDDDGVARGRPVTDFVQKEPVEGAPPTDRMEVRFVYDDAALYVGARM